MTGQGMFRGLIVRGMAEVELGKNFQQQRKQIFVGTYLLKNQPPSTMSSKPSVTQLRSMMTRRKNKDAHPGMVVNDAKQKRRTAKEMEEVRVQEARAQEEKQKKNDDNLKIAAAIEDKLRREDIERRRPNRCAEVLQAFRPPPQDDPDTSMSEKGSNEGKSNFLEM